MFHIPVFLPHNTVINQFVRIFQTFLDNLQTKLMNFVRDSSDQFRHLRWIFHELCFNFFKNTDAIFFKILYTVNHRGHLPLCVLVLSLILYHKVVPSIFLFLFFRGKIYASAVISRLLLPFCCKTGIFSFQSVRTPGIILPLELFPYYCFYPRYLSIISIIFSFITS